MKQVITYWFSFLLILLWMTSCGTHKRQKSEITSEVSKDTISSSNEVIQVNDTTNVNLVVYKSSDEVNTTETTTFTPIDPSKPSSFTDSSGKRKVVINGTYTEEKTTSRKKDNSKAEASKATANKSTSDKSKLEGSKTGKKDSNLNVTSESQYPSFWNLLWLLIPIALYVFWKIKN